MNPDLKLAFFPNRVWLVRWKNVVRFITSSGFILLFFIAVFAFATFDPKSMAGTVGFLSLFFIWLAAGLAYVAGLISAMWAYGTILGRRGFFFIPFWAILSVVWATWVLWELYALVSGQEGPPWSLLLRDSLANYMWVMLFEVLVHVFVLPNDPVFGKSSDRRPDAAIAEPTGTPERDSIVVAGQKFLRSELRYLRSEGHLVNVVTAEERFQVRARLHDIVAQLGCIKGFQPHRSWWVSTQAVAGLEVHENRVSLQLFDGEIVNVARSRMPEFEALEEALHVAARAHRRSNGRVRRVRLPAIPPSRPGRTDMSTGSRSRLR